ncbi:unnamed protein product [Macrosiphum euphorbiae]|uniref:FLYWCH-type domain-containing protein n=2 Tax=Macrosiphum euphorbiae TaxID=13131 RepID=A0AAV0VZ94_9HEMI|nr:unnamed protein product [Macrosiphum euphorbiae]
MPLKFIKSQKGKNMSVYNGFLYSKHEVYENKIVWRCSDFKKFACKSRCHTTSEDETGEILKYTDHSHAPNVAKSEAKGLVNEIKKSAENGQFSTR